jgi:hypothetical protein
MNFSASMGVASFACSDESARSPSNYGPRWGDPGPVYACLPQIGGSSADEA